MNTEFGKLKFKEEALKNSGLPHIEYPIPIERFKDLIALEGGRDRRDAHPLLKKKFYKSIWQDQVRLGIAPALKECTVEVSVPEASKIHFTFL